MSNTQPPKCDNKDFITKATQSAMATEVTAQATVRARLVDSQLLECSTLCVNDLFDK